MLSFSMSVEIIQEQQNICILLEFWLVKLNNWKKYRLYEEFDYENKTLLVSLLFKLSRYVY